MTLHSPSLFDTGLSYNEPGVEPALGDLFRYHPALTAAELVEANERHMPR